MKFTKLNGWWRLVALISLIWVGWVLLACLFDGLAPRTNSWLFPSVPNDSDPLGLFPKLNWWKLLALLVGPVLGLWLAAGVVGWVVNGFLPPESAPLLKAGRLQDVLALLQVLALDQRTHRSASGLLSELQGPPRSAAAWSEIAESHPEFFRVQDDKTHGVSLVARHVSPQSEGGVRDLPVEFTGKLLNLAVELHDRQLRRARAWEVLVPLFAAVIAGVVTVIGMANKP